MERYQKVLFNVALRMVGDLEDARDIVQSTFTKAYEKLASYDPRYKFFSWIYKIAVNESLDTLRRRRDHEPLPDDLVAHGNPPGQEYEARRQSERIQAAIMRLSPDYREVVILRHFVELSYREMAELIGIEEKTVKSRLFTARRRLADWLDATGGRAP